MKKSEVIEAFGGPGAVADKLGISQPAVSKWPEIIPELRARQIAELKGHGIKFDPELYKAKK